MFILVIVYFCKYLVYLNIGYYFTFIQCSDKLKRSLWVMLLPLDIPTKVFDFGDSYIKNLFNKFIIIPPRALAIK